MQTSQRAFTLVELSIVLVILGLLIGGVLTGQSLIRAAELRSVSTQYARYVTATQTFRDKYFALPGDMTNATAYWGTQDPTPSTCFSAASSDTKTCNGNGDGKVIQSTGSDEGFRFFQHLANAGLIEGSYDGIVHGPGNGSSVLNSPSGRISGSLWFTWNWGTLVTQTNRFDGVYDNILELGGYAANTFPSRGIFSPQDMYNMDMKMDDGMPARGKVVVYSTGSYPACTNGTVSSDLSASYLLDNTTQSCTIVFRQVF